MEKFEEQFNKIKQVEMTSDERGVIRTHLARLVYQTSVSRVGILSVFSLRTYMPIILIIAVLLGGGVSVAAERALPGDMLYPIKVDVNEKVVGVFKASEGARADWDIRLAERRLEEAEKLSERGEIKADVLAKIEGNFSSQADRVKERIASFQEKKNFKEAADVSERFETSLEAHEGILAKLSGDDSSGVAVSASSVMKVETSDDNEVENEAESDTSLIEKVRAELDDIGQLKLEIEAGAEIERD